MLNYYFAYGSNLLLQRMLINGYKTIKFDRIAKLNGYRLAFRSRSESWKGSPATIEQSEGDHVWGAVWTIDASEVPLLDEQEGEKYERIKLTVVDESNETIECMCYKITKADPSDCKPSFHYLNVIIRGAVQCGLPSQYIEGLKNIQHNGYNQPLSIIDKINSITV